MDDDLIQKINKVTLMEDENVVPEKVMRQSKWMRFLVSFPSTKSQIQEKET